MSITASFVGNVGNDAEVRTAAGNPVCDFNVAVSQGFGDSKVTNWLRVSLWGKRAESLSPYIKKGAKVFVTGELTTDEYQGKQQLRVRADRVDPFLGKKGEGGGGFGEQRSSSVTHPAPQHDDDLDQVPF